MKNSIPKITDQELLKLCDKFGKQTLLWRRKFIGLLPEVDKRQLYKKRGCKSIFEFAAKLAGMSRESVENALRVIRHIENMPALKKVAEEKGLYAVRPVVAIATFETDAFWANKAKIMGKSTLETYVREYKKQFLNDGKFNRSGGRPGTEFRPENLNPDQALPGVPTQSVENSDAPTLNPTSQPETKTLTMNLSLNIAAKLEKLKGNGSWDDLMNELLKIREKKFEAEKPQPIKTSSRHISAKVKNFAIEKTRGQCAYPGCTKPYKIIHHTQRFALDPVHDPDHLAPLCEAHEHLAHHGLIANEDFAPEKWEIMLEPTWYDFKQVIDKRVMECRKIQEKKDE